METAFGDSGAAPARIRPEQRLCDQSLPHEPAPDESQVSADPPGAAVVSWDRLFEVGWFAAEHRVSLPGMLQSFDALMEAAGAGRAAATRGAAVAESFGKLSACPEPAEGTGSAPSDRRGASEAGAMNRAPTARGEPAPDAALLCEALSAVGHGFRAGTRALRAAGARPDRPCTCAGRCGDRTAAERGQGAGGGVGDARCLVGEEETRTRSAALKPETSNLKPSPAPGGLTPPCAALLSLTDNLVVALDDAGRVCGWNEALARVTGVAAERATGAHFVEEFVAPQARAAVRALLADAPTRGAACEFHAPLAAAGGEERCVRWRVRAVPGGPAAPGWADDTRPPRPSVAPGGGSTGGGATSPAVLLVGRDGSLDEDLVAQVARLQRVQALGALTAAIAHDLNNLLTSILGYSELAWGQLAAQPGPRALVEHVYRAGRSAQGLTRRLTEFGRPPARCCAVAESLDEAVRAVERLLAPLLDEDVTVDLRLGAPDLLVPAARAELEQVVMNLVINARDAMPQGGTLTLATRRHRVTEAPPDPDLPPGEYLCLEVRDTGTGIAAAHLPRIFEPYFTTKEAQRGTGLGLDTVRRLATRAGGAVRVESALGRGSTFQVYWPAVGGAAEKGPGTRDQGVGARFIAPHAGVINHAPTAPRSQASSEARAPTDAADEERPGRGETVLLVEDDADVRAVIGDLLRAAGYAVLAAADGREALRLVDGGVGVDLVVTDVVMPYFHGVELARRLHALRPALRVLYCTGYSPEALVTKGIAGWECGVVAKPASQGELLARVRAALDAPAGRV